MQGRERKRRRVLTMGAARSDAVVACTAARSVVQRQWCIGRRRQESHDAFAACAFTRLGSSGLVEWVWTNGSRDAAGRKSRRVEDFRISRPQAEAR